MTDFAAVRAILDAATLAPIPSGASHRADRVARNLLPELLSVAEAGKWAVDYIRRHGGVDNDYHDIERAAFAGAAIAALDAKLADVS